jgi:NAD(P)H-dependent flavin oxidoreductase YrpB (nitropropane dioxygenase family)
VVSQSRCILIQALLDGRGHEYLPFTGQSVGLVTEVLPAAEIVRRVVEEAEEALHTASGSIARPRLRESAH